MNAPAYISNYTAVTDFYGYWPSFHDANVVGYESSHDSIILTLHIWHTTKDIDEEGYYIQQNHALVTFRFKDTFEMDMGAFAAENILYGMELIPASDLSTFHVELDSVMEMSGSFSARSGEVISVTPYTSSSVAI